MACFDETRVGKSIGIHRGCGGKLYRVGFIRHGLESRCFLDQCGSCGRLIGRDRKNRIIGEADIGARPERRPENTFHGNREHDEVS